MFFIVIFIILETICFSIMPLSLFEYNELAKVYKRKEGALILDISPETPAAKYGLKRGDLIYSINGKPIKDKTSLQNTIASFPPDEKIKMDVERDEKDISLTIVLGDRSTLAEVQSDNFTFLGGLKLSAIDVNNQKQYRLTQDSGVFISDVEPKSKAEKVGFQPGDIIVQIEDVEIKNFTNVEAALKKYNNKYKRVYVNRYGQTILFVVQ